MSPITDPSEEYFKDGTWGWDGSVWRKLPLLWGYSDRWTQEIVGTAVLTGDATANATPVPDGYVYVLQAAGVVQYAVAAEDTRISVVGGGIINHLVRNVALGTGIWLLWRGEVVLKKDDYIQAVTVAPGDTKTNVLHVWGYKMRVAA